MAFMQPEYYSGGYDIVETTDGETFYVMPGDDYPDNAEMDADGNVDCETVSGVLWQLSAPGYMDCTDWTPARSMEDAREDLSGTYDVCADCGDDLDETSPEGVQCADCKGDN